MRRAYKRRRDLVRAALEDTPATLLPIHGGLHAVLLCEEGVVKRAADLGLTLTPLRDYWGGAPAEEGVVLGFGHLSDVELAAALELVKQALA